LKGYLDALKTHKIPINSDLIISYDLSLEKVKIYVQHFLTLSPPSDALFCMNNPTAIAAMRVIKQNKLQIPQDIVMVGFSNDLSSELVGPALATVAQPLIPGGKLPGWF
jgi:DNA-binding LacI/PurR family transcriptional regulator